MLLDPSHYQPPPVAEEVKLSSKDKEILRRLAGELVEVAALPVHKEKARLWQKLNDRESKRPMVWINEICWHEVDYDGFHNPNGRRQGMQRREDPEPRRQLVPPILRLVIDIIGFPVSEYRICGTLTTIKDRWVYLAICQFHRQRGHAQQGQPEYEADRFH